MVEKELAPVHFSKVTIDDSFWALRIKINRETTIPCLYKILEEIGHIDSLKPGWKPGTLEPRHFGHAIIYKWLEAASYSTAKHPDSQLRSLIDGVVELIKNAQQPSGYIPASYLSIDVDTHWTGYRTIYCAGHMFEAAVAHFRATGERILLDVACRYADYYDRLLGNDSGKEPGYSQHPEAELAFMRLYQATGEKRYANFAKYLVDQRGQQPHYFDRAAIERGEDPTHLSTGTYEHSQAHKPIREQDKVVGHAVQAMYLFSGITDVAAESGDEELRVVLDCLWNDLTLKKMYITGGVGSSYHNEGFTKDYDLPNETAYAETCAAIGLVFWAHRMLQFECDGRYADVMERTLYNALLSGVSLDGKRFFYENPLESLGNRRRKPWFQCPCCPPNIARLIASLGNYIYSQSKTDVIVHLYIGGSACLDVDGQQVNLRVDTGYPWDGKVVVSVEPEAPASFGLSLRIPSWCPEFSLKVNGKEMKSLKPQRGYIRIEREWRAGDRAELSLSMPIELVMARPEVREDAGRVAIQRGPLVYCLEQIDNNVPLNQIVLPGETKLEAHFEPELLDGVVAIYGDAFQELEWENQLYHPVKEQRKPIKIKAIPYYAWNNRGRFKMRVWI